ncbi:MAG: hypothetical protein JWO02_2990 [Solirubrobacterales bacterium]|nr:hypothetical protein [Solirubrobacterales bacterium]
MPHEDLPRELPQALSEARHVQLVGRADEPWVRRGILVVLAVVLGLGLAGTFGQRDRVSRAATPQATLRVAAPERLRGGLFFQARFDIAAVRDLKHPTLVLGEGWAEQMQINTIEPGADKEDAPDGRLHLEYGELKAGQRLTVWMQMEVNPVSLGRRDQSVELMDSGVVVARVTRRVTVFF